MNKTERNKMREAGIHIIRAQYNHRKQKWQIARNTDKGGWEVTNNDLYETKEEAQKRVDALVSQFHDTVCKD